MNRRSFLSILAGVGAASATSYFFAPICGWKSDVIAQPRFGSWGKITWGEAPQWFIGIDYMYGAERSVLQAIPYANWAANGNVAYMGTARS